MPFGAISCKGMKGPCFSKNTPVLTTNRGYVLIQDIDIIHDTINNQSIIALVSDIKPSTNMVMIRAHAFKHNIPSNRVIIDSNCKVEIDRDLHVINNNIDGSRMQFINYKGYGYNVILKGTKKMLINNMLTDTLSINSNITQFIVSELLDIAEKKAHIKIKTENISSKLIDV